jgi:multiple sugar transport system permease protein
MAAIAEKIRAERFRFEFIFDRPQVLGSVFLAPAILYVLILVGIPFLLAVYYAFSAYTIYDPSYHFVGLRNFVEVVQSEIFRRTLANTFIFTIGSQILGLILGKFGALLLLRPFPGRKIVRALIILPWAAPWMRPRSWAISASRSAFSPAMSRTAPRSPCSCSRFC